MTISHRLIICIDAARSDRRSVMSADNWNVSIRSIPCSWVLDSMNRLERFQKALSGAFESSTMWSQRSSDNFWIFIELVRVRRVCLTSQSDSDPEWFWKRFKNRILIELLSCNFAVFGSKAFVAFGRKSTGHHFGRCGTMPLIVSVYYQREASAFEPRSSGRSPHVHLSEVLSASWWPNCSSQQKRCYRSSCVTLPMTMFDKMCFLDVCIYFEAPLSAGHKLWSGSEVRATVCRTRFV